MIFTPARRLGLRVLAEHDNARISRGSSVKRRTVAWQTADWLISQGLAERRWGQFLYITGAGESYARQLFDDRGLVCI